MAEAQSPRWFYKAVVGFRPTPPKSRGKKKKPKRPKPIQPKKGDDNFFKVLEGSTDMSQDSASREEWRRANLEELTDEELETINLKMVEISKHAFEDEETNEKVKQLKELTTQEIKVIKSRKHKERLRKQIEEKLARLPKAEITEEFVEAHFADILQEYREKLDEDLVLPRPEEETPMEFVFSHIKKIKPS